MDRAVLDMNDMTWVSPSTTRSSKGSEETKKSKGGLTEEEKDEMFMSFSREKMQNGSEDLNNIFRKQPYKVLHEQISPILLIYQRVL